jgi:hypothetical protein
MGEVLPMPHLGDLFVDVRGEDRTMRVSCHADRGMVVVSLWAGTLCRGSFRVSAADLDRLIDSLDDMRSTSRGVRGSAGAPRPPVVPGQAGPGEPATTIPTEETGDIGGLARATGSAPVLVPRVA